LNAWPNAGLDQPSDVVVFNLTTLDSWLTSTIIPHTTALSVSPAESVAVSQQEQDEPLSAASKINPRILWRIADRDVVIEKVKQALRNKDRDKTATASEVVDDETPRTSIKPLTSAIAAASARNMTSSFPGESVTRATLQRLLFQQQLEENALIHHLQQQQRPLSVLPIATRMGGSLVSFNWDNPNPELLEERLRQ
jgi:WD40 repeat protein